MRDFSVRWQNFKSIKDSGWLKFKSLTILIGPNNNGKTNFFAPLLLLKQTLESEDTSVRLNPRGKFINLGTYRDFIYQHDMSLKLILQLGWQPRPPTKAMPQQFPIPAGVKFEFKYDRPERDTKLQRYEVFDKDKKKILGRTRLKSGNYLLTGIQYPEPKTPETRAAKKAIKASRPVRFLFESYPIMSAVFQSADLPKPAKSTKHPVGIIATVSFEKNMMLYVHSITRSSSVVERILNNINYIGPLRERPKRLYETSGERPMSVGIRGEFAPEILFRSQNRTFKRRLTRWVEKFDFGSTIHARRVVPNMFTLELERKDTKLKTNFADAGFGVSQIFPIIVAGLSAKKDSYLIFEQPEIHLNPRLQSVLAQLFAYFVSEGINLIVETHSEHFLLRLRQIIASGQLKSDKVNLYYVEKKGERSLIREIFIREDGHIDSPDWPKGFFDETLRGALELAGAQVVRARKLQRGRKRGRKHDVKGRSR